MLQSRNQLLRRGAVILTIGILAIYGAASLLSPPVPAAEGNILANADFESAGSVNPPTGWSLDDSMKSKGTVSVQMPSGHSSKALQLRPNSENVAGILAFNIAQGFSASPLHGKTLAVSVLMKAEGAATAIFGVYAIDSSGNPLAQLRLMQPPGTPAFVLKEGTLSLPANSEAALLIVSPSVEGTGGAAFFDDVSVQEGAPRVPPAEATVTPATISVQAGQIIRSIPPTLYGQNLEWSYGGNMIWDFRNNAMSPELIRLTREMGVTLLRFPGGTMADFYHWKNGVGMQAGRPTTEHMPGDPKSKHTFGTDEALSFAEQTGSRLLITVNAHNGTPKEAAEWVSYVRINGLKNPARAVQFWEIGNEFYIKSTDPSNASITPDEYARRLPLFASAMKAANSAIKIIAIGAENYGLYRSNAYADWNEAVLSKAAASFDYLAVHNAYLPVLFEDNGADVRTVYASMLASPILIKRNLAAISAQVSKFAPSHASRIKLAVTEWGPIFHVDPKHRMIDHVKTLGSGLFVASTMKAFIESPTVDIANAFKLNEPNFMGWIQITRADHLTQQPADGQYRHTAPSYALQMFTKHFGTELVASTTTSSTYDSQPVGMVEAISGVPHLESLSSLSRDLKTLYVMAINKHLDSSIRAAITLNGFTPAASGTAWTLSGTGIDAHTGTVLPAGIFWGKQDAATPNGRFASGGVGEVTLKQAPLPGVSKSMEYEFPARSVTVLEIRSSGS